MALQSAIGDVLSCGSPSDDVLSIFPVCNSANNPLFWPASRQGVLSAWYGHVPFAHWLVTNIAPRKIVELGTHNGVSYGAFCEPVKRFSLRTECFAIDTWMGDAHSGQYGDKIYNELYEFNRARYGAFSTLMRGDFNSLRDNFGNNSIDLLHIDGLHTYESVKHDFDTWLPKMSSSGVVLFHDIAVRDLDFGVWQLWAELTCRFPSFAFTHSHGLGVLAVGAAAPKVIRQLCTVKDDGDISTIRQRFERLGEIDALRSALVTRILEQNVTRISAPIEAIPGELLPSGDLNLKDQEANIIPATSAKITASPIKIGIGVVTFNRSGRLRQCIDHIVTHTKHPYELFVADDGSTDDTQDMMNSYRKTGIGYLFSKNRGVNWNKNRILFYFMNINPVDVIIILEDDSFPYRDCWEDHWITASRKWGHINNAGEWFADKFEGGRGLVDDPFLSIQVSAQCTGFSRNAIDRVGFFDPNLENFGGGHAEHSYRMARVGYGGEFRIQDGVGQPWYYLINGGIYVTRNDSNYEVDDPIGWSRYWKLRDTPIYRSPWRDDRERLNLINELENLRKM